MFLSGCCNDKEKTQSQSSFLDSKYSWEDQVIDGMTYRIYFRKLDTSQTGYTIAIVNLTKDKLEVEALQKQLKN
jgi:hypothetical protein